MKAIQLIYSGWCHISLTMLLKTMSVSRWFTVQFFGAGRVKQNSGLNVSLYVVRLDFQ